MYQPQAREPDCVHSHDYGSPVRQPASACSTCKDGDELREWSEGWVRWFAEHPDDPTTLRFGPDGTEWRRFPSRLG